MIKSFSSKLLAGRHLRTRLPKHIVCPMKYSHGYQLLCLLFALLWRYQQLLLIIYKFIHILQGCFLTWLFQCQRRSANNHHTCYTPIYAAWCSTKLTNAYHDDVIKWKHFPRYWPFVGGPVNSPHKGQWRRALMFSLICAWINDWVNNGEAGDLRRNRAHYDVIVMQTEISCIDNMSIHPMAGAAR